MNARSENNEYLKQAADCWNGGEPIKAGQIVYENLPNDVRPKWAANILRLVISRSGLQSGPFDEVLNTADQQIQWKNAHRVFSSLRDTTLQLERIDNANRLTKDQALLRFVVALAELVAKVTYNATNPTDEFDEDSGWWIAASLRGFVDLWSDDEFTAAAWSTLCFEDE